MKSGVGAPTDGKKKKKKMLIGQGEVLVM